MSSLNINTPNYMTMSRSASTPSTSTFISEQPLTTGQIKAELNNTKIPTKAKSTGGWEGAIGSAIGSGIGSALESLFGSFFGRAIFAIAGLILIIVGFVFIMADSKTIDKVAAVTAA
jgi:predicted lipid-binding transport protein (Tim44 family)